MCATSNDGKHVLREIRLMRWLGKHMNIISLKDLHVNVAEDELYCMLEL
jgi:serine/threonine protein kinase